MLLEGWWIVVTIASCSLRQPMQRPQQRKRSHADEPGGRLIEEEQLRATDQDHAHARALALAA
jgi:hypothetical protein